MKRLIVAMLCLCCAAVFSANYLLDVEKMNGDWQIGQGRDAQGGAMLVSTAKGSIAQIKVVFPEDGKYYVSMRTMSFGGEWRRASVYVDGKLIGTAGDEKFTSERALEFVWARVRRNPVKLTAGVHEVKLVSACPNARIDALLFSTDRGFKLPGLSEKLPEDSYSVLALGEKREFDGELSVNVSTDRNPVSYRCGEPISFVMTPTCDGKPMDKGFVSWSWTADDGGKASGLEPITGKQLTVKVVLKNPGFVRFKARLLNSGKMPLGSTRGNPMLASFDGGAGADIADIKAVPEPSDFDAFWTKAKAELAQVPLRADTEKVGTTEDGEYDIYKVSIDCAGPRPATGYMTIPADAEAGSLPIEVTLAGYGVSVQKRPARAVSRNAIGFSLNAHGMKLEQDKEYYDKLFREIGPYALREKSDNPADSYFYGMAMRVMRTLQFVKTLPEWNKRDLAVTGGSQGGLQAIWAASLDHDVTKCNSAITWGSNIGSWKLFGYQGRDNVSLEPNGGRGYFDSVNHAKRVKCPTVVPRIGLGDYTCPPSGVCRMYFNLKCPKHATFYQNSSHSVVIPGCETFEIDNDEIPRD